MPSQTVDFLYKVDAALAGLYVSLVSNVDGVTKYPATATSDVNGKWAINPKPPAGPYALYTGAAQGVLTTLVDPDFVVDPFNDDGTAVFPKQVTVSAGGLVVTAGGINVATGGLTVVAGGAAITGASSLTFTAGTVLVLNRADGAAALMTHVAGQRAGANKWWLGLDAADQFALLNAAGAAVNVGVTDAGLMTVRAGVTVTAGGIAVTAGDFNLVAGNLVFGAANQNVIPGATALRFWDNGFANINLNIANNGDVSVRGKLDVTAAGQLQVGAVNASSIAMRGPQKSLIVGNTLTALGAGAQTLTAAALLGGEIEHTVTGAVADTFDTGTNLDAAIPNVATGDSITCILTVLGAFTVTLTAAAGITLRGTAAVVGTAAGKVCVLVLRRTGVNAWTVYAATGA